MNSKKTNDGKEIICCLDLLLSNPVCDDVTLRYNLDSADVDAAIFLSMCDPLTLSFKLI